MNRKKIDDFIRRLVLMKDEAARLGLWETMHELDKVTQKVGWEYAGILKRKGRNRGV